MEEAGQVNSARVFLHAKGWDQVTGLEAFGQKANELPQSGVEYQISQYFLALRYEPKCLGSVLWSLYFSVGILDSLLVFADAVISYAFS